jgi:hypothetical protein
MQDHKRNIRNSITTITATTMPMSAVLEKVGGPELGLGASPEVVPGDDPLLVVDAPVPVVSAELNIGVLVEGSFVVT